MANILLLNFVREILPFYEATEFFWCKKANVIHSFCLVKEAKCFSSHGRRALFSDQELLLRRIILTQKIDKIVVDAHGMPNDNNYIYYENKPLLNTIQLANFLSELFDFPCSAAGNVKQKIHIVLTACFGACSSRAKNIYDISSYAKKDLAMSLAYKLYYGLCHSNILSHSFDFSMTAALGLFHHGEDGHSYIGDSTATKTYLQNAKLKEIMMAINNINSRYDRFSEFLHQEKLLPKSKLKQAHIDPNLVNKLHQELCATMTAHLERKKRKIYFATNGPLVNIVNKYPNQQQIYCGNWLTPRY